MTDPRDTPDRAPDLSSARRVIVQNMIRRGPSVPSPHASTHSGGSDPMVVDAAAATGSLRTLGTGALQAAAGNDPRFTDARPPIGPATGDLRGNFPNPVARRGSEDFALTGHISASISANVNDWSPAGVTTASRIDVKVGGANRTIGGIAGGSAGRILVLHCLRTSLFAFQLLNESAGSAAANRFSTYGLVGPSVNPGETMVVQYSTALSRWTTIARAGA